jgi:myo-inositol 2-dehydrogenase / D-chiro-inositol 1-dehydrogenase
VASNILRVGVVGCGRAAETRHLPTLAKLDQVRAVALADLDPSRLRRVAEQFRIEGQYPGVVEMVSSQALDIIVVSVPACSHVEVAEVALTAGKHVLVEKPLAVDLHESDRLLDLARHAKTKVMMGFNMRSHRLVREARAALAHGAVGCPALIQSVMTGHNTVLPDWRKRRALGGGVFYEQAVHHFDAWRFLLGTEVEEVFATSQSDEADDHAASVTARLSGGVLASCVLSQRTSARNEIDVYGDRGRLQLSCHRFDGLWISPLRESSGGVRPRVTRAREVIRQLPAVASVVRHGGDWLASYRTEWEHFVDAIQNDTPLESTLDDGRRAVQVVLAALESSASRRAVRIDPA